MLARLHPKLVWRQDPGFFDACTLFDSVRQESFALTRAQFRVIEAVAGGGVPLAVARECFVSLHPSPTVAARLWSTLVERGLVAEGPDNQPTVSQAVAGHPWPASEPTAWPEPVTQRTAGPTFLDICLTRRCDLRCVHCNVSAHSLRAREVQSVGFWRKVMDEAVAACVLKIVFSGGEPTRALFWDELYDYVCTLPLAVSILTNGIALTDRQLALMRDNGHTLAISVDGASAATHDQFRGVAGAFDSTIRTLRRLDEARVGFTLTVTLHRFNLGEIEALIRLAEEVRAEAIVFNPINSVGRGGAPTTREFYPAQGELWATLSRLQAIARQGRGVEIVIGDYEEREYTHILSKIEGSTQMSRRHVGFCKAGTYALAIDADGKVYSCLRGLQTRTYPIGDLAADTLPTVWADRKWLPFISMTAAPVPCRIEALEREIRSTRKERREPAASP